MNAYRNKCGVCGGQAKLDPVAKFHLGNGATLHRVNLAADDSEWRMRESYGVMVNYDYNAVAAKL